MSDNFWLYFFGMLTQIGLALIGLIVALRTKKQTGENTLKISEAAVQVEAVKKVTGETKELAEAARSAANTAGENVLHLADNQDRFQDLLRSDVFKAEDLRQQVQLLEKRLTDYSELRTTGGGLP